MPHTKIRAKLIYKTLTCTQQNEIMSTLDGMQISIIIIIDLLQHSLCAVLLISNSPLVPVSQEAIKNKPKQTSTTLGSK